MQGFTRFMNTRQDVMNSLELFQTETKQYLQQLLDNRYTWWTTKKLYMAGDTYLDEEGVEQTYAEDEAYVEDSTHRVLENQDEEGNVTERYAQEYMEDPNAFLVKKLGLSFDEAAELIGG